MLVQLPKPHSRKQAIIMNALMTDGLLELWVACGTKFGKAAYYQTLTPTPDRGYIPFCEIKIGDFVFDEHGKPTKVISVTDLMYDHDCYEITFSDGTKVIADAEHDWITTTHAERKNIARALSEKDRCKTTNSKPTKRNTLEIFNTQKINIGNIKRPNHAIENVLNPLEFNKKSLPIPPYTLGTWLGDGDSHVGVITKPDEEIAEYIVGEGFDVNKIASSDETKCARWHVKGLTKLLKDNHLYKNKHIPNDYLISSIEDRIALLHGLMDTDGTVDKRGNCCFDNTNKNLADGVALIAQSLGIKVNRGTKIGRLNGVDKKLCYRVWFTTDFPVFRLKRKAERIPEKVNAKSKQRMIVDVKKVESVPVMCIQVENPSHLFLTTESCIPTHNSLGAGCGISSKYLSKPGTNYRWVAPIYSQAKIGFNYIKSILHYDMAERNLSALTLTNEDLGNIIEFKSGKFPEDLEGEAINGGYVLDECAKMTEQVYDSAKTTLTVTRAPMINISTPRGKNWFYKKCMEAKDEMEWAIKNDIAPSKIFITAASIDNPYVTQAAIDDARASIPERLFKQYYLAEFIDDGSVFTGVRDILFEYADIVETNRAKWIDPHASQATVVVGADWAKTVDYTVFFAFDIETGRAMGFWRFQKVPYTEAVRRLMIFCKNFKDTAIIKHDKTGVGSAIDDQLAYTGLSYSGLTFTNQLKSEMVAKLMTSIEQKAIMLPNWQEMLNEFDFYEVTTNALGTTTYGAVEGKHDDIVTAILLANVALLQYGNRHYEINYLESLPKQKETASPVEQFYMDAIDDDFDD